jgi:hypothetical protein
MIDNNKQHGGVLMVFTIILLLLVLFIYAKRSDERGYNTCRQFIMGENR